MKALKEKRASLRSLFRGSLAILSILALAFAFAACGSNNDNDTTDPGPGPGPGPQPDPVYAVSIAVLQQPQYESFQGCPPNLKGLIAHVRFSDGTDKVIGETHADFDKLFTLPGYCDVPSNFRADHAGVPWASTATPFTQAALDSYAVRNIQLGYADSAVFSSQLIIPFVVEADALQVTGPSVTDWFSDQRPDYSGLAYEIIKYERKWATGFDTGGNAVVGPDVVPADRVLTHHGYSTLQDWKDCIGLANGPYEVGYDFVLTYGGNPLADPSEYAAYLPQFRAAVAVANGARRMSGDYKKFVMPMTAAYPKYDMTRAKSQKEIVIWVGAPYGPYIHSTYPVNPEFMPVTGYGTSFKIQNFWEVSGVEFVSASFGTYFDDQVSFFGAAWRNVAGRGNGNFVVTRSGAIKAVIDAKPRFKVFYFGGKNREISLDEFLGNNSYYVVELGFDTSVFHGIHPSLSEAGGSDPAIIDMLTYQPQHAVVAADSIREFKANPITPRPAAFPFYIYDSEAMGDAVPNIGILNVNDDTGTWNITLEYVPAYYLDEGVAFGGAWVSHVDVPFPIYVFDDQIEVRPIASAGLNHIRMIGLDLNGDNDIGGDPALSAWLGAAPALGGVHGLTNMSDGQLQAINDKWDLVGSYSRGSDRKERVIPFTKRHFFDGFEGRPVAFGGSGTSRTITGMRAFISLGCTNDKGSKAAVVFSDIFKANSVPQSDSTNAIPVTPTEANQLPVGVVGRDWPLPVYYRGQLVDNEETVLIDLIGPGSL